MNTQVLVAGAGPVGLMMAASLARLGVAVRLMDKAPAAGNWCSARHPTPPISPVCGIR